MSSQHKRTSVKQKSATLMRVPNITNIKQQNRSDSSFTASRRSQTGLRTTRAPGDLTPRKQHKTRHRRPSIPRVARSGRQSRRPRILWITPCVYRIPADKLPQLVHSGPMLNHVQRIAEVKRLSAPPPATPGHDGSSDGNT